MTNYTVEAVEEALGLLMLVAKSPGLGTTELATRSGNTKARTFRLLYTLEKSGLLCRDGDNPTYLLGYNSLYLGVAAESQIPLARLAKTFLRDVGTACNENVQIRVRDGLESVCVARWESSHPQRMQVDVGNRRPLYVGASSKILLAHAPEDVQNEVINSERVRYTGATLVSKSSLKQSLAKILSEGYTISHGEMSKDSVAIAAPVYNASNEVVASISVAGPAARITDTDIPRLTDLIIRSARDLSNSLGHR